MFWGILFHKHDFKITGHMQTVQTQTRRRRTRRLIRVSTFCLHSVQLKFEQKNEKKHLTTLEMKMD